MSTILQDWRREPLGKVILARVRGWWRRTREPDPWPEEDDRAAHAPDAVPICHRCCLPVEYESNRWFCSNCGAAAGEYNNLLPYIRIFSIGEVLRSGVGPEARFTAFTACGYTLVCWGQFGLFFPFYMFRVCRNIWRKRKCARFDGGEMSAEKYGRLLVFAVILTALLLAVNSLFVLFTAPGVMRTFQPQYTEPLSEAPDVAPVLCIPYVPDARPRVGSDIVCTGAGPREIRIPIPIVRSYPASSTQNFYRINVDTVSP